MGRNTFRILLQYMFTCCSRNSQRCLETIQEPPPPPIIPLYFESNNNYILRTMCMKYNGLLNQQIFPQLILTLVIKCCTLLNYMNYLHYLCPHTMQNSNNNPETVLCDNNIVNSEQYRVQNNNNRSYLDVMITSLSVGSSLMHLFTEVEEYIGKITDYGIDQFIEELLTQVYKDIVSPVAAAGAGAGDDLRSIPSTEGCLPLHTDSSHGLFTPFSELELGNTKEYPFPEHFRGWRDSVSVASSFDPDTVWEIMKGPDPPPTYRTPLHMCIRNWSYRIVASVSFVVCWLICCMW